MTTIRRGVELTPEEPLDAVVDHAVAAETAGFDAVLCSSHYFNRDPFAALARVATETNDVALGPAVVNPYDAHPVALASRAATLQEASDGRALFGIGAGDASTLASLGVERERPLRRVLESVEIVRSLWAGERVSREGAITVSDAGLNFQVGPLPVYVGAQGPDMLGMAAARADGVLFNAAHPTDVAWASDRVEEGLERRDLDGDPAFVVQASVSVAREESAARETARQAVAFIVGGAPEPVLDRHGIDRDLAAEIGDLVGAGSYREAFDAVTGQMVDAFAIAGTPEQVAQRFARLDEYADGIVAGTPIGPDRHEAIDLLADAIL